MNINKYFLIFFLLISLSFCFKEWWEESNVIKSIYKKFIQAIELNNDNFDDYVGNNNYVVVEFYTKWCHFCKLLSPEYDKLAKEYQNKRKDVIISRLEGQANDFTLQRYGIFRFPVIALFKPNSKNIYTVFRNQRNFEQLDNWITEACPILSEKDENNVNNSTNDNMTINMTEIEKNQNLTSENEYIKNEFIDINKRIENIKNKLNLNNKNDIINKKTKDTKIKFEFDLSPIFIILAFFGLIVAFSIYSCIKNILFINKEHIK